MERQDLNQSQLGAFKFTPVENIQDLTNIATNYMNQQIASYLAKNGHQPARGNPATRPPTQAASMNPGFFNNHIKNQFSDSRLRLGPAAFRRAVEEAATSPQKQQQQHFVADRRLRDRSDDTVSTSYSQDRMSSPVSFLAGKLVHGSLTSDIV
jgi:hypothetical protein